MKYILQYVYYNLLAHILFLTWSYVLVSVLYRVEDAANPNAVNINAEEVPLNNQNHMAQGGVQCGQLSSITLFSGTKGLEALTYAEAIDGSLAQFGWTQAQAAQAAISRGGNAVANWIRGERAAGITYITWTATEDGQRPLRPAFIARFGPVYTTETEKYGKCSRIHGSS